MPDHEYSIKFKNDVDQPIQQLDRYIAKVREAIKVTQELDLEIKAMGKETSLDEAIAKVQDLTRQFIKAQAAAEEANKAIKNSNKEPDQEKKAGGGGAGPNLLNRGMVIMTARQLLRDSSAAFSAAQKTQIEHADKAQEFRAQLLPMAELLGKKEIDNPFIEEMLGVAEQTGTPLSRLPKSAEVYFGGIQGATQDFESSGGKKGMSRETATKLFPHVLRMANRLNLKNEDLVTLASRLGTYQPIANEQQGIKDLARVEAIMNLGAQGTLTNLMGPLNIVMGQMAGEGGAIPSPDRAAATLAAATLRNGSSARAAQELKSASTGLYKIRGNQAFGTSLEDDYHTSLNKVIAATKGMSDAQLTMAFKSQGLAYDREIPSVIKQIKAAPRVEQILNDPDIAKLGNNAEQLNLTYLRSQAGKNSVADARKSGADVRLGLRAEPYVTAMANAYTRLQARGEIDTAATNMTDTAVDWLSPASWVLGQKSKDLRLQAETNQDLQNRFQAAGVSSQEFYNRYPRLNNPDFATRSEEFQIAEKALEVIEGMKDVTRNMGQVINAGRPPGNAAALPFVP